MARKELDKQEKESKVKEVRIHRLRRLELTGKFHLRKIKNGTTMAMTMTNTAGKVMVRKVMTRKVMIMNKM